ncbi:MAG: hypothetical protein MZV63_46095 [Marinilabiliales bacterium]|nr:hypothetical protein [Marinilabiliales bacterium]
MDNVGCHVVFDNHFCYDLTTMVATLLWVTTKVLTLPISSRSVIALAMGTDDNKIGFFPVLQGR